MPVEGTPQEVVSTVDEAEIGREEGREEVEESFEKEGVRCRMLLDTSRPRLGSLLRLGVEVQPTARQKTGVAGLSTQPDPSTALKKLRRVRVEMFRRVRLPDARPSASSSTTRQDDDAPPHLSLLYASGKSMRYPGNSSSHPPLRVLFTIPTAQLGSVADTTWGEITQSTPYHIVTFFIRVTIGFDGMDISASNGGPWLLEREIEVRPKIWREPQHVVMSRGTIPASGLGDEELGDMTEEEMRQAYRLKGRDIVGETGTYRADASTSCGDSPPPFDGGEAGPSHSHGDGGGLPTFLESEEQMRTGEAVLPNDVVHSERLVPLHFGTDEDMRNITVGRRGSLGGELGTWIEVSKAVYIAGYADDSMMDTKRFPWLPLTSLPATVRRESWTLRKKVTRT